MFWVFQSLVKSKIDLGFPYYLTNTFLLISPISVSRFRI